MSNVKPPATEVVKELFVPKVKGNGATGDAIALVGALIMSLGAHLFSKQLLTMCIANYEPSGSQVQLTLERGLPAIVGSFASRHLPFPYLSFDMDLAEDALNWNSAVRNYWSLLSPLIFSDHPKRPGDEDPSPPFNMLRNVLDMNARLGGFYAALLNAGKSVWVIMSLSSLTGDLFLHDWSGQSLIYIYLYLLRCKGLA
ncbi:uncharacterized protein A4U43_C06F16250 [Asparagus officinalis]|uniref:Methyltransferase n=1 Tax=Asparagus officinalis TaxID=4686 RepID=A0A5P1EQR3_ASPOF|nr:uncharacterized protein A4U43_C06F16250 [Asparagus officinalis]